MATQPTRVAVAFRIDPAIKAKAIRKAAEERRSLAGYLEWLIVQDTKDDPGIVAEQPQQQPKKRRQA